MSARFAAFETALDRPGSLRAVFLFLASGNAHDAHGIADHVGGALFAFRTAGHEVFKSGGAGSVFHKAKANPHPHRDSISGRHALRAYAA